ncbi:MAG: EpsI family protein [Desulfobacterales bacterium]|nr:EpsI family protein [Desulfobacterales bacterium]
MQNKTFITTTLVFLLTLLAVAAIASRKTPVVVQTNLENIPMQIGGYTATDDTFPQSVYDELNADKHVYRHYKSPDSRVIDLYIGYYGTAKGGRTGHNPYACLPGAGWGIVTDKNVRLYAGYKDAYEEVNYTITRKGDLYNVMLHWYHSGGTKVLDSGLEQNIQRFVSRVTKNRNDGAFIQISMQVQKNQIEPAFSDVQAFAEKVLTMLPRYWPIEQDV